MTAFTPIPPKAALEMMAGIPEAHSLLADLAQAGIVKAYARLFEIEGPDGKSSSRDKRLPADVWKRAVSEWKVKDIFSSGTVRIPAGVATTDEPAIVAIGIRFDPASVRRAAQEHGQLSVPVQEEMQVQAEPQPQTKASAAPPPSHTKPAAKHSAGAVKPQTEAKQVQKAKRVEDAPQKARQNSAALLEERIQLTKNEAAEVLNISMSSLNKLINQSLIETTQTLSRVHVTVASIKKHLGM